MKIKEISTLDMLGIGFIIVILFIKANENPKQAAGAVKNNTVLEDTINVHQTLPQGGGEP